MVPECRIGQSANARSQDFWGTQQLLYQTMMVCCVCLYVDDGLDAVCGLNQLIGSFSRSVPNKLLSRQKVTSGRDRWLFMGDSRAGTQLDPADNK